MESLLVPMPPSLSLALMQEELVANLHMPSVKVSAWRSALVLSHPTCQTCGDLMALNSEEMRTAFEKAELTSSEVATVQVCLGTVGAPFQWRADVTNAELAVEPNDMRGGPQSEQSEELVIRCPEMVDGQDSPPAQFDPHRPGADTVATPFHWSEFATKVNEQDHETQKLKKKKGGPMSERSEVLVIRRPEMVDGQYFPPAQFDPHRPGAITRNEKVLRKLIVQEVCTSRVLHACTL
jgi:hypothetical protein